MPIGIGKTTAGRSGNVPQVNITGYTREVQKRLFYSRREQALLLEKTVRGGFGNLEMGQVMTSVYVDGTDVADFIVPLGENGRSVLVSNAAAAQRKILLSLTEKAKFAADEAITITDANNNEHAVIDSAEVSGEYFAITIADSDLGETYEVAEDAYVTHRQGGNYYVMDQNIDAGEEDAGVEGALTSVAIANAILYKDAVIGMSNTALSAFNGLEDGIYYVIR